MNTDKKEHNYTATPIRLKEIKAELQIEAAKIDRSLNWLVVKVLKDFLMSLKSQK